MQRLQKILNPVAYQIGWFLCLYHPSYWWLVGLWLPLHLYFFGQAREWRSIVLLTMIGGSIDSLLTFGGVFHFPDWNFPCAPPWLWMIWALFGTTLAHSLSWLQDRPRLAAFLGLIAGPAGWNGGAKLGIVVFGTPFGGPPGRVLWLIALIWALLLPGGIAAARWARAASQRY